MKDLWKILGSVLLYVFAAIVLIWTASLTMDFVARVLPENEMYQWFALALYDGGALAWCIVFLKLAQGAGQRATSLGMLVFDLAGACLLSAAEIILGGQDYVQAGNIGKIAVFSMTFSTLINAASIYIYHIANPETQRDIATRAAQDKIISQALGQLEQDSQAIAADIAGELSLRWRDQMIFELGAGAQYLTSRARAALPSPAEEDPAQNEPADQLFSQPMMVSDDAGRGDPLDTIEDDEPEDNRIPVQLPFGKFRVTPERFEEMKSHRQNRYTEKGQTDHTARL